MKAKGGGGKGAAGRTAELTESSVVVATKDQAACDLSGEAVILNLESGIYYGLNAVGTRIWELLGEPRTVGTIRDTLLEEFDVDSGTCMSDLLGVLGELRNAGLLEVGDGTGA